MEIAQWVGFGSFALGVLSFWQKDDHKLKMYMLAFYAVHTLHFLLLGSMTSAFSTSLSLVRTCIAIKYSGKLLCWMTIAVLVGVGTYLATSWVQIFAILGTTIGTYSIFNLSGIRLRFGMIIGAFCWLTNNILMGSIGGIMLESTLIMMNLLTAFRIHRSQQQASKSPA
ncbi:YgjV family protein [Vibrio sp. T187]|uniref:YgjV family protein n=1 Tax=Vibrio TaxID=662 RepID=UPI0010C983B6|nr:MULTISPECIES: YgjV family protein [Vibrio]MBW3695878.1 YgjV family protein [Vibrio sp. T187]